MIYWLTRFFFRIVFKLFFRLKVFGAENVPAAGPLIFAANHSSYADPPLIASCVNRPVYFIAKKELFKIPLFCWLIKKLHAFSVDRVTVDFSALKNAIKILNDGNALLIFPEGTRRKNIGVKKLKNGAAMLSAVTSSLIVPVAILNTDRLFEFPRLIVKFGVPMKYDSSKDYGSLTNKIMSEVEKLKDE